MLASERFGSFFNQLLIYLLLKEVPSPGKSRRTVIRVVGVKQNF